MLKDRMRDEIELNDKEKNKIEREGDLIGVCRLSLD
jgi:hypothetical protein